MSKNFDQIIIHNNYWEFNENTFKPRRNFSLVARYSFKFTRCLLLIVKPLVTRCKIRSLLVAEVARCKNSLILKNHLLFVAKFDRYLLHKFTSKSHGRQHLNEFESICWMFYINKNHMLPRYKIAKFSIVILEIAHGSSHPMFCK